jgi:hypothetical protein
MGVDHGLEPDSAHTLDPADVEGVLGKQMCPKKLCGMSSILIRRAYNPRGNGGRMIE